MTDQINHAYCVNCNKISPVTFEGYIHEDDSNQYRGGDVICKVCYCIVAILYKVKGLSELCSL